MRARFSAFALKEVGFLIRTLHPEHVDLVGDGVELRRALRASVQRCRYVRLTVLGADGDWVHFRAEVFEKGKPCGFEERSWFRHDGTGWRYLRGETAG